MSSIFYKMSFGKSGLVFLLDSVHNKESELTTENVNQEHTEKRDEEFMMKNIKLTAFDMDGTLLNDRKELPPDFPAWVKNHLENLAFRPLTMPLLCADKPLAEGFGRKIPR